MDLNGLRTLKQDILTAREPRVSLVMCFQLPSRSQHEALASAATLISTALQDGPNIRTMADAFGLAMNDAYDIFQSLGLGEAIYKFSDRPGPFRIEVPLTGHFPAEGQKTLVTANGAGYSMPLANVPPSSCAIVPAVLAIPAPTLDASPSTPRNASRAGMSLLGHLLVFPLYIAAFLADCAILFIIVRLISDIIPARPILFLDRIGSAGVDEVTEAIMARTGHWFKRPLSRRQEYAWSLLLVSLIAWALSFLLKALTSS